jgi:hypothetical protein
MSPIHRGKIELYNNLRHHRLPPRPMVAPATVDGSTGDGGSQHPRWPMVAAAMTGGSTSDGGSHHPRWLMVASAATGW